MELPDKYWVIDMIGSRVYVDREEASVVLGSMDKGLRRVNVSDIFGSDVHIHLRNVETVFNSTPEMRAAARRHEKALDEDMPDWKL